MNFVPLSRQEKRELAQRLSSDVRRKCKKRPPEQEDNTGLSVMVALNEVDAEK